MWAELARELADTLILPHDVGTFAKFVRLNTAKILSTYNELLISGGLQAQMSESKHVDNMLAVIADYHVIYSLLWKLYTAVNMIACVEIHVVTCCSMLLQKICRLVYCM